MNERKCGLTRKKRCLMGCSRSVTCLTGTISLTHLVCHSEASVYSLIINRPPECFWSKLGTCTRRPDSYLRKAICAGCIVLSNHLTWASINKYTWKSFDLQYKCICSVRPSLTPQRCFQLNTNINMLPCTYI